jgi:hypothetical protein
VSGKAEALRLFRKCKQLALQVRDGEKRKELLRKVLDRLTDERPSDPGIRQESEENVNSKARLLLLLVFRSLLLLVFLFSKEITVSKMKLSPLFLFPGSKYDLVPKIKESAEIQTVISGQNSLNDKYIDLQTKNTTKIFFGFSTAEDTLQHVNFRPEPVVKLGMDFSSLEQRKSNSLIPMKDCVELDKPWMKELVCKGRNADSELQFETQSGGAESPKLSPAHRNYAEKLLSGANCPTWSVDWDVRE